MDYEGQICRAPMERASYMLPVAVGCSYNACRFCTLFKHLAYRELPMEQIEAELRRVRDAGGAPRRVFLGDGNAFGLPAARLLEIIDLLHRYFPDCGTIHMDATVTNIAEKTDHELAALHREGVSVLYLGIESGLADVLCFMNKDHTLEQAYEQIRRIQGAGYQYAAHIMTGIAGRGRGLENAERTARFLSETKPCAVINFSLFLHRRAPLYREIEAGHFIPADEVENLLEERRLLELLEAENLAYDGFHDRIAFRVKGSLPEDRERLLARLDREIEKKRGEPPVFAFIE